MLLLKNVVTPKLREPGSAKAKAYLIELVQGCRSYASSSANAPTAADRHLPGG